MRFSSGLLCGIVGTMMVFLGDGALRARSISDHGYKLAPLAACDPDKPVFNCLPKWPLSRG